MMMMMMMITLVNTIFATKKQNTFDCADSEKD